MLGHINQGAAASTASPCAAVWYMHDKVAGRGSLVRCSLSLEEDSTTEFSLEIGAEFCLHLLGQGLNDLVRVGIHPGDALCVHVSA